MSLSVTIPIRTVSEANSRDHWAKKAKRAKQQRQAVLTALCSRSPEVRAQLYRKALDGGIVVTLTRVGKRKLDSDNLSRSCKAPRDSVAQWLGIDDGDERIEWRYAQEIGREYAVRVEVV